jgi:hypothetical protein
VPLSNFVLRGFRFVHHSIAILYHEVPNPNLTIRNFYIHARRCGGRTAETLMDFKGPIGIPIEFILRLQVRTLERHIAALCRTTAVTVVTAGTAPVEWVPEGAAAEAREEEARSRATVLTRRHVEEVLGPVRFEASDLEERIGHPGVVAGLAWTAGAWVCLQI